jgi:hypothetical protein
MLRKFIAPLGRVKWGRLAGRVGGFAAAHRSTAFRALAGFAGLVIVLLIHREVYSFIAHRRQYTVPVVRASVAPAWADGRGMEEVRVETGGVPIADPGLVERVGRAFEACAWVRKVTAVERAYPDRLRIRFEYRRPHAAVRRVDGYVLVDADGVRLPGIYGEVPEPCVRRTEITGIASAPPRAGHAWADPAVRAGLAMADMVAEDPALRALGIREVDLSNYGGRIDARRSEVSLVVANGCTIFWGRMPATARYGDASTDEKIDNLRQVLSVYPRLDGLRCVKLYFKGIRAVEPVDAHVRRGSR